MSAVSAWRVCVESGVFKGVLMQGEVVYLKGALVLVECVWAARREGSSGEPC